MGPNLTVRFPSFICLVRVHNIFIQRGISLVAGLISAETKHFILRMGLPLVRTSMN